MNEKKYPTLTIVLGMPKRPRNKAIQTLEGNLPLVIAEHLFKILCVPNSMAKGHWLKEVKELFRQLLFGISKSTRKDIIKKHRIIEDLHFDFFKVQTAIDDMSMDASEILDSFPPEEIELPPPDYQLVGNLTDYGFRIKQYSHPEQGIQWKVFLEGKEIVDTAV